MKCRQDPKGFAPGRATLPRARPSTVRCQCAGRSLILSNDLPSISNPLPCDLRTLQPRMVEVKARNHQAIQNDDDGEQLAPELDPVQLAKHYLLLGDLLGFHGAHVQAFVLVTGERKPIQGQAQYHHRKDGPGPDVNSQIHGVLSRAATDNRSSVPCSSAYRYRPSSAEEPSNSHAYRYPSLLSGSDARPKPFFPCSGSLTASELHSKDDVMIPVRGYNWQ